MPVYACVTTFHMEAQKEQLKSESPTSYLITCAYMSIFMFIAQ